MHPVFHVFGAEFPAYGVFCALGVVLALIVCILRVRKSGLRADAAFVVFTGALAFGLAGALVVYGVVTYGFSGLVPMLCGEKPMGFVFYGGLISGLAAALALMRILRLPFEDYAREMLPALPLAHAVGRIGCFFAGCCYGRPTDSFIGVRYPPDHVTGGARLIPVPLMEAAILIAIFFALCSLPKKRDLSALRLYVFLYAPARFFLEFLRGDAIRGVYLGLSTSQWLSLLLFICIILIKKIHVRA